jgi:hypothetical protein
MEVITWSNLELNKNEAAAKGTLIKYKLGIKDGAPISVEQLKYLKEDSAICQDHCLLEFLESITDFDEAASWLSRNAYSRSATMNLLGIRKYPNGMMGF